MVDMVRRIMSRAFKVRQAKWIVIAEALFR
jgi:hypothetical protein